MSDLEDDQSSCEHEEEGSQLISLKKRSIQKITKIRNDAKKVVEEATRPQQSIFIRWTPDGLRELLAEHNIQVRGANNASHTTLVRICDEVFGQSSVDFSIEEESRQYYTIEDLARMNRAALRIQEAYIRRKQKFDAQSNFTCRSESALQDAGSSAYKDYDRYSLMQPSLNKEIPLGDSTKSEYLENNGIEYTDATDFSGTENNIYFDVPVIEEDLAQQSESAEMNSLDKYFVEDEELNVEWRKPSWKFAKKHEAICRPHHSGQKMQKYNWRKDTLGRHCFYGGCGEQLDIWNEGQTSEFSQFGSGITNYFKFLKWCCWVMFILGLIHFPGIIINMFGVSVERYDTNSLALTTLGNLGSAKDIKEVKIPGCDEDQYKVETCTIHKNRLAFYYSILDAVGTIFVIIAWIWLKMFEKKEVDNLNRNTVNASDYTIRVTSIPPVVSERELAVHFANLTDEAVAEVSLAFKNSKEISLYFKRGHLVRERFHCVTRIRYELSKEKYKTCKKSKRHLKRLLRKREKLTSLIQMSDENRMTKVKSHPKAIQAFVTFETENGFLKAMSQYQQMNLLRTILCCYPRRLRLKGRKLKVSQAPEPSTIIWENLEVPERSRLFRKCLTTSVATLAIFLSVIFTFLARDFKFQTLKSTERPCPYGFSELSHDDQYEIIHEDTDISHCYCSRVGFLRQWQENVCYEYAKNKFKSSVMSYCAGFMTCAMNIFFTWLMDRAGSFEKHESLDAMQGSNMARVFVLKFVNTGCLILLYSVNWLQRLAGVRFEDPQNFNTDWYETGGVGLVLVMIINIFSPHISSFLSYRKHRRKIKLIENKLTDSDEIKDSSKEW